jgi:hypothetical protein
MRFSRLKSPQDAKRENEPSKENMDRKRIGKGEDGIKQMMGGCHRQESQVKSDRRNNVL